MPTTQGHKTSELAPNPPTVPNPPKAEPSASAPRMYVSSLLDEAQRATGGELGHDVMGVLPQATSIGCTGTPVDCTAQDSRTFKTLAKAIRCIAPGGTNTPQSTCRGNPAALAP